MSINFIRVDLWPIIPELMVRWPGSLIDVHFIWVDLVGTNWSIRRWVVGRVESEGFVLLGRSPFSDEQENPYADGNGENWTNNDRH